MDVGMIFKIAGIGILITVTNSVLSKSGRDEYCTFCTIAGIMIVLLMLVGEINQLFSLVKKTFGL